MTEIEDGRLAALMRAAQAGDAQAYQAVLRASLPVAASIARRQGVRPEQIDDVTQDVLLTVHRALATYDPDRPFLPWLRAIAQRRAIDALRRQGRRGGHEVFDEPAYLAHPDMAAPADQKLDSSGDALRLRSAIATLPDGQRQAVEWLGLRERSLDETAGATGRTKNALKVNLHRALKALRLRLGEPGDV